MTHWVKILQLDSIELRQLITYKEMSGYRSDSKREWSRALVMAVRDPSDGKC